MLSAILLLTFKYKIRSLLLFLSLFSPLLYGASELLQTVYQAEKRFSEGLYSDALPLYSEALSIAIDEPIKTELTLRLASCYLEENYPQTAIDLLSSLQTNRCHHQSIYLMSLAHRQLKESSYALEQLLKCSFNQYPAQIQNLIALEKGYHYTQLGDFRQAETILQKISLEKGNPLAYYLAQLFLTQIHLSMNQFEVALERLTKLSYEMPEKHPLQSERIYLQGWLALATSSNLQATLLLEKILPADFSPKAKGSIQVFASLIVGYLRQAIEAKSSDQSLALLSKAEILLKKLIANAPTERSYLLLADFFLIKAKYLGDRKAYQEIRTLLEKSDLFPTAEGYQQARLKCAEAAPTYQERRRLFQELMAHSDNSQSSWAKICFLTGLNDFEEGCKNQTHLMGNYDILFEQAAQSFEQIVQLEQKANRREIATAFKYLILAKAYQSQRENIKIAWQCIIGLIENPSLLSTFDSLEEIYCLSAWIALRLSDTEVLQKAQQFLKRAAFTTRTIEQTWKARCLKLEGLICLQLKEWQQADALFARLLQECPNSSLAGEIWFWRAYSADQQNQVSMKKEFLSQAYTEDPKSPYAPIAYFQLYSYREYVQGNRKALKHLQTMPHLFPSHPLLISAYYLMGMYHKKDILSEEGEIIRHKDWTAAIEAFSLAETTFDALLEKNLIPNKDFHYFSQTRYYAQLERAQANLAIAQSSIGGKRIIYLEYAEGVFKELIKDFMTSSLLMQEIDPSSSYFKILSEAEFQLAKTYEEKESWKEAETTLTASLERHQKAQLTQHYGCMRIWYEKGTIAQKQADYLSALHCFVEAEKANHDYVELNPHEKLDLWIQQSLCYKALNQLENAMRLLSRVINDPTISPLRIQAMFLRAEIYELQGRPELAIKQLEAAARQKGPWGKKAKEKLEQIYGYSLICDC